MKWLERIASEDKHWREYAYKILPKDKADELIQEMYLRIYSTVTRDRSERNPDKRFLNTYRVDGRLIKNSKPNRNYIHSIIQNMAKDYLKNSNENIDISQVNENEITHISETQDYRYRDIALTNFHSMALKEIKNNSKNKFNALLFQYYFGDKDMTMRDIQSGTGIDLHTIWNGLDKGKKIVKQNLQKEYDYLFIN